jgi:hypothetical protein
VASEQAFAQKRDEHASTRFENIDTVDRLRQLVVAQQAGNVRMRLQPCAPVAGQIVHQDHTRPDAIDVFDQHRTFPRGIGIQRRDVSQQMVMVPSCASIAVQPRKAISRIQRKQELRTTAMFYIRVAG